MVEMFNGAISFNQDISAWDVSQVEMMSRMFSSVVCCDDQYESYIVPMTFNQDLSNWSVANVTQCDEFAHITYSWTRPKPNFTSCYPGK